MLSAKGKATMPGLDRIIRLKTVLARTGLSRSTLYRKIAEGTFPAQIKISVNGLAGVNPMSIDGSTILSHGTPVHQEKTATSGGRVARCCHR